MRTIVFHGSGSILLPAGSRGLSVPLQVSTWTKFNIEKTVQSNYQSIESPDRIHHGINGSISACCNQRSRSEMLIFHKFYEIMTIYSGDRYRSAVMMGKFIVLLFVCQADTIGNANPPIY